MTYRNGVEGTGGDSADTVELLWPAPGDASLEHADAETETTTFAADQADQPEVEPEPDASTAADEWDDLRQVLAGDAPVTFEDDEDDEDEDDEDEDDDDDDEPVAVVVDALAELTERVEDLEAELREERAARERLAGQLDRLAVELDGVLGEALAAERHGRQQLEETLRQVQATITETYDGPERRTGEDRRSAGERRRGLPPRPLRARRVTDDVVEGPAPAPVADADETVDDDAHDELGHAGEEATGVWQSRLHDVAGSVSAWSAEDIDRLRVD